MRKAYLIGASLAALAMAGVVAGPAGAQRVAQNNAPPQAADPRARDGQAPDPNVNDPKEALPDAADQSDSSAQGDVVSDEQNVEESAFAPIVVTAQRQSQNLQDVPIAVSAFSAAALDEMQIHNAQDLQLSLPNVTYTKTNFTSSSFTIRGIGDLCTGATCDQATAIHINDMPLMNSRLFETEYLDLQRVEVLRGPQGTLFGRNATAGVVNFITAPPNLSKTTIDGEAEYGNYNFYRFRGTVNVPISDRLGVRGTGYYIHRKGYTKNLYNDTRSDGRKQYSFRGSVRWEPTDNTRVDLIGNYMHERDDRMRSQKQLCARDNTGILGCRPDMLSNETTNGNATLGVITASRQLFNLATKGAATDFGLYNMTPNNPYDPLAGSPNPSDRRKVYADYNPTYYAMEQDYMGKITHDFGKINAVFTGGYMKSKVDSTTDYYLSVTRPLAGNAGLNAFYQTAKAPGSLFLGGVNPYASTFAPVINTLLPNGPNGDVCQSSIKGVGDGTGVYGGHAECTANSLDPDRSRLTNKQWSTELHIDSDFDGKFNFLVGGIYLRDKVRNNDYFVNSFGIDYASGVLGAMTALGQRAAGNTSFPNVYMATPFYRNQSRTYRLNSYGIFGEVYYQFNDKLKLTLGGRYNHDSKKYWARSTILSFAAPYGIDNAYDSPFLANYDADGIAANGINPMSVTSVKFSRGTGRAVLNYQITDQNMVYASYSRGYKSGGINPPLQPIYEVPGTFKPETVDAFEIGSKNTFLNDTLRLNLTAFHYRYKDLQLARIVARTAVNDNVDARIWGIEAEAVVRPSRQVAINLGYSYLHTKIAKSRYLADPQDPSAGRSDTVIIKDVTNASNCAVAPNREGVGAAASNGFVTGVNNILNAANPGLGLAPAPVPVAGTTTTGSYSVCSFLQAAAAGNLAAVNPALAAAQASLNAAFNGGQAGALPFTVHSGGVPVDIKGNKLPQAPRYKFNAGVQWDAPLPNDITLTPRVDVDYTGEYHTSVFNRNVGRVPGYIVVNARLQVSGPKDRWFIRGYVQNLANNKAVTGKYVTDQSTGLFTNIFTLEPRRYGVAVGFKF